MKITCLAKIPQTVGEDEIIQTLLKTRKIEKIDEFLSPLSPLLISITDFGFEKELKKTLAILEEIKKKNQMVVVYTDYDADGITGGSILWETLHLLGFNAMPYVPHRKHEGYGFSIKGIDAIKEKYNPGLIISVDHGITAVEKVAYAKSIGIPIIITDHHLKQEKVPDEAEAIFHISTLSGSSVSYFFSKAVFDHFKSDISTMNHERLTHNFSSDYLSLAAVGTIADLVPLIGAARSVVKYGLAAFPKIQRPGIKSILREAGIEGKIITSYEVGFIIAPRINAVGRLEHAINALRLLCTTSEEKATELAQGVGRTNQERQELVKSAIEEAKKMIEKDVLAGNLPNILILTSSEWHEGIIGLIASKMVELYYRPVIVMTQGDGFLKGSARSIPHFHITDFLRSVKEYLVDVGGHTQAAGFTILTENLSPFTEAVYKKAKKIIKKKDLEKIITADLNISLSHITSSLVKQIETLSPFGIGNPQPVFYSNATLEDVRIFGKHNEHLRMTIKNETSQPLELIAFSKATDFQKLSRGKTIEVVYQPEINRWNGTEKLQGKLIHWQ